LGADGSVPKLENVMNSMSRDERLEQAKSWRQQALSEDVHADRRAAAKNSDERAKSTGAVVPPLNEDSPDLGEDVPSIEEVLEGATWEDRLAKARIRREQVVARRNPGEKRKASPAPDKRKSGYKNTISIALSGAAPARSDETPENRLYAPTVAGVTSSRAFPRWQIAAGIVVLIGLAATVTTQFVGGPQSPNATAQVPPSAVQTAPATVQTADAASANVSPAGPLLADTIANIPQTLTAALTDEFTTAPTQNRPPSVMAAPVRMIFPRGTNDAPNLSTAPISTNLIARREPDATKAPSFTTLVMTAAPNFTSARPLLAGDGNTFQPNQNTFGDPGLALDTKLPLAPALQLASLPTAGPLPNVSSFGGVHGNDGNSGAPEMISQAMSAVTQELSFPKSGQGESLPTNFGSNTTTLTKPTDIAILNTPAKADLPLALPSPATAFRVASISPTFPLFDAPVGVPPVLAPRPRIQSDIARAPGTNALPSYLPQTDTPVASDPPAPYTPPDVAAQSIKTRDYAIRLSAPSSLSENRLNTYAQALGETGYNVGKAKRVDFRVSQNHVRFFHTEDKDTARQLATAIGGKLRDFTSFSPSPEPGTIEIWLAGNSVQPRSPRTSNPAQPAQDPALTALRNRLIQSLRRGDHL